MYYLTEGTEKVDRQTLTNLIQKQGLEGEQLMATIAQEIRQEALQEGLQVGLQKGRQEERILLASRLLDLHDVVTVSELTGLTLEEVQAIVDERGAEEKADN